ncbi:hypothetical protein BDZ89DRAFT_1034417 [Hymenopellis radicata]|nr:hypothetical protein BDZ89DRAFT_1034417 [Hymenopellis radicata]
MLDEHSRAMARERSAVHEQGLGAVMEGVVVVGRVVRKEEEEVVAMSSLPPRCRRACRFRHRPKVVVDVVRFAAVTETAAVSLAQSQSPYRHPRGRLTVVRVAVATVVATGCRSVGGGEKQCHRLTSSLDDNLLTPASNHGREDDDMSSKTTAVPANKDTPTKRGRTTRATEENDELDDRRVPAVATRTGCQQAGYSDELVAYDTRVGKGMGTGIRRAQNIFTNDDDVDQRVGHAPDNCRPTLATLRVGVVAATGVVLTSDHKEKANRTSLEFQLQYTLKAVLANDSPAAYPTFLLTTTALLGASNTRNCTNKNRSGMYRGSRFDPANSTRGARAGLQPAFSYEDLAASQRLGAALSESSTLEEVHANEMQDEKHDTVQSVMDEE